MTSEERRNHYPLIAHINVKILLAVGLFFVLRSWNIVNVRASGERLRVSIVMRSFGLLIRHQEKGNLNVMVSNPLDLSYIGFQKFTARVDFVQ